MKFENKLSVLRRTWALTQENLGELVGLSKDAISNYERLLAEPAVAALIGFEVLFGKSLPDIFPHTTYVVAQRMLNVLAELSIEVEGDDSEDANLKRSLVSHAGDRIARIIPEA